MATRRLKTICPHCNRAIQIDLDEREETGTWVLCTPLPVEESNERPASEEKKV